MFIIIGNGHKSIVGDLIPNPDYSYILDIYIL